MRYPGCFHGFMARTAFISLLVLPAPDVLCQAPSLAAQDLLTPVSAAEETTEALGVLEKHLTARRDGKYELAETLLSPEFKRRFSRKEKTTYFVYMTEQSETNFHESTVLSTQVKKGQIIVRVRTRYEEPGEFGFANEMFRLRKIRGNWLIDDWKINYE